MDYARAEATIDQPIETVWAEIARFDGLERWASGVTACSVEGAGVGAVRTVTLGDRAVRERLMAIEAEAYRLRYLILSPNGLPADEVYGTITLEPGAAGITRIAWHSDASAFAVPPEQLGARIEQFYATSIDGLRRLLSDAG